MVNIQKQKGMMLTGDPQGVNFVAWAAGDMSTAITLMPNPESIVVTSLAEVTMITLKTNTTECIIQ